MTTTVTCVFCGYDDINRIVGRVRVDDQPCDEFLIIRPLDPVTGGHLLIVPRRHVEDASVDPVLTGRAFQVAAALARLRGEHANLITSIGEAATQTVFHLHVHVVPRRMDDGLLLPWSEV